MAGTKRETLDEVKQQLQTEKIDPLSQRVEKCYSQERYEEFQEAVEKIIERYLKSVVGWAVFLWLMSVIGSMFLQKIFNIF